METIIKIHDAEWFDEHCRVIGSSDQVSELKPKYKPWTHIVTIQWLRGDCAMNIFEGRVLKRVYDSGVDLGHISGARYMYGGYWIPNWAIEWIKEE